MPFGLCNAPSTFMRVMNQALRPLIGSYVVVYFNDILVYSKLKDEHLQHLRAMLLILHAEYFYSAPAKCTFFTNPVLFLDYCITITGIRVYGNKIAAICDWPTQTSMTYARSFHGLTSFYKRSIPYFSSLTTSIKDSMRGKTFSWRPRAFRLIKEKLTYAYILVLPDFSTPFE